MITTRPWRHHGLLVDFPAAVTTAAEHAGLTLYERNVALLAGLRGDRLVPARPSFNSTKSAPPALTASPLHIIAHEDVLVSYRRQEHRQFNAAGARCEGL